MSVFNIFKKQDGKEGTSKIEVSSETSTSDSLKDKKIIPPTTYSKNEIIDKFLRIKDRFKEENIDIAFDADDIKTLLNRMEVNITSFHYDENQERKFLIEEIDKYFPSLIIHGETNLKDVLINYISFCELSKESLNDRPKNFDQYNKEELYWKFLAEGKSKEIIDYLIKSVFNYDTQLPALIEKSLEKKKSIDNIIEEIVGKKDKVGKKDEFLEKYKDELTNKNGVFYLFTKHMLSLVDDRVVGLDFLKKEIVCFLDEFKESGINDHMYFPVKKDKRKEHGVEAINVLYFREVSQIVFHWMNFDGRRYFIGFNITPSVDSVNSVDIVPESFVYIDKETDSKEDAGIILDLIKILHDIRSPRQIRIEREEEQIKIKEELRKKEEEQRIRVERKKARERKRMISIKTNLPKDETEPITVSNTENQSHVEFVDKSKYENSMYITVDSTQHSDFVINKNIEEEMKSDNKELYIPKINIEGMRPKEKDKKEIHISIKVEPPKDKNNF